MRLTTVCCILAFVAVEAHGGPLHLSPTTLRMRYAEATVILFGRFEAPRLKEKETDFITHEVLRFAPLIKDRKVFTIDRFIHVAEEPTYLLFGDEHKGKPSFYSGIQWHPRDLPYARNVLGLDPKDPVAALRFFARHLEHASTAIGDDAFAELTLAPIQVRAQVARKLDPATLRQWTRDAKMDAKRRDLYASLLAWCGNEADADELLKRANESRGMWEGHYTAAFILKPKTTFALVKESFQNPKQRPFVQRFCMYRAVRTLYDSGFSSLSKDELLDLIVSMVEVADSADLAINDLRRWERWDHTDRILKLYDLPTHRSPIVRGAIVRFALVSPRPNAAAFVAKVRVQDPELIQYLEEELGITGAAPR